MASTRAGLIGLLIAGCALAAFAPSCVKRENIRAEKMGFCTHKQVGISDVAGLEGEIDFRADSASVELGEDGRIYFEFWDCGNSGKVRVRYDGKMNFSLDKVRNYLKSARYTFGKLDHRNGIYQLRGFWANMGGLESYYCIVPPFLE